MDADTKALVERVASEAANRAVDRVLTSVGVDVSDPIEVQKDMAALRDLREVVSDPEFQQDLIHLRKWRKAMDAVQNKGLLTIIGLVFTGAAAAFWIGFKGLLGTGN